MCKNAPSVWLSMMLETSWHGWNAYANSTRTVSWNGLVAKQNVLSTSLCLEVTDYDLMNISMNRWPRAWEVQLCRVWGVGLV